MFLVPPPDRYNGAFARMSHPSTREITMEDMTTKLVHRSSGQPNASWDLGPYQIEALLTESEESAGTAYRVRIEANQKTDVSFHQVAEEFYYVLSGSATAILDGQSIAIRAGDFLRLPPGTRHAFVTADEPLEMLDVHIPGCRPNRDTHFERSEA